jgi:hypothetical protein
MMVGDIKYTMFFINQLSEKMGVRDVGFYIFRMVFLHLDDISLGKCYQLVIENTNKHSKMLVSCDYPNKLMAEAYKVVINLMRTAPTTPTTRDYLNIHLSSKEMSLYNPNDYGSTYTISALFQHGITQQYLIRHEKIYNKYCKLSSPHIRTNDSFGILIASNGGSHFGYITGYNLVPRSSGVPCNCKDTMFTSKRDLSGKIMYQRITFY